MVEEYSCTILTSSHVPKLRYRAHALKLIFTYISPKLLKRDKTYKLLIYLNRTYLLSIHALDWFKANIEPVLEYINFSYIAQNHLSVTVMNQYGYGCQMCISAKF